MSMRLLSRSVSSRAHSDYVFFWKASNSPYAEFSNWFPSPFRDVFGREFVNAEQYMMFKKALLMKDDDAAAKILCESDPQRIKRVGRDVKNFDESLWNRHARDVVRDGCLLKFEQNKPLRSKLLGTEQKILVEASPFDRIWGIGFTEEDALQNIDKWGTNWLGIVLMDVRTLLRSFR